MSSSDKPPQDQREKVDAKVNASASGEHSSKRSTSASVHLTRTTTSRPGKFGGLIRNKIVRETLKTTRDNEATTHSVVKWSLGISVVVLLGIAVLWANRPDHGKSNDPPSVNQKPSLPAPEPGPTAPWPSDPIHREFLTLEGQTVIEKNLGASSYIFRKKVDHKSRILVVAPRGTVEFSTPPGTAFLDEGSKVDDGSLVVIVANSVTFRAKIDSDNARVFVILTTDGQRPRGLIFADNMGEKTRAYWCTDGGDPGTFQAPKDRPDHLERRSLEDMLNLIRQHGFVGNGLLSDPELQYLKWYLTERPK
jgi:hypothetical protein